MRRPRQIKIPVRFCLTNAFANGFEGVSTYKFTHFFAIKEEMGHSFPFVLAFIPQRCFRPEQGAIPVPGFSKNLPPVGAYFPKSPLASCPGRHYGCCIIINHKKGKVMQRATLEAVGLKTEFNIPAGTLFSVNFEPERFGLKAEDKRLIGILRDFVSEYNREVPVDDRTPISSSRQAAEMLFPVLRGLDHEEVWALFLTKGNLPISRHLICSGALDLSVIDTRKIVKIALEENAACVILFHNHPSGNPLPSKSDIAETEKLQKAFKVFDLTLLDHIIISDTRFFSFCEEKEYGFSTGKSS